MFLRHLTPGILWAVLILILCGMPGDQIPRLDFWEFLKFDKVVHFILFAMQVLIITIGFRKQHNRKWLRYHALSSALAFGLGYGILTEVLQLLVFRLRHFDYMDVAANSAGALAGTLLFLLIYGRRH